MTIMDQISLIIAFTEIVISLIDIYARIVYNNAVTVIIIIVVM